MIAVGVVCTSVLALLLLWWIVSEIRDGDYTALIVCVCIACIVGAVGGWATYAERDTSAQRDLQNETER